MPSKRIEEGVEPTHNKSVTFGRNEELIARQRWSKRLLAACRIWSREHRRWSKRLLAACQVWSREHRRWNKRLRRLERCKMNETCCLDTDRDWQRITIVIFGHWRTHSLSRHPMSHRTGFLRRRGTGMTLAHTYLRRHASGSGKVRILLCQSRQID